MPTSLSTPGAEQPTIKLCCGDPLGTVKLFVTIEQAARTFIGNLARLARYQESSRKE
jgi:hypothetical protein